MGVGAGAQVSMPHLVCSVDIWAQKVVPRPARRFGAKGMVAAGFCQEPGCLLNRAGTGPARVAGNRCKDCGEVKCATHCLCGQQGLRTGRRAGRTGNNAVLLPRPVATVRPIHPVATGALSAAARPLAAGSRARSRSRSAEGRRCSRATIEHRLLGQWQGLSVPDRPLPPPGRADSGLAGYGTWADGIQGASKEKTKTLLSTPTWRATRTHASVHLTMYLRWAETVLREQAQARTLALDVGRHIQQFLA